jgi:glutamate racemase
MRRNPGEEVIYIADRAHFPYGAKNKNTLEEILTALVRDLDALFKPKLAVLACNTATVSALAALRERFPGIPWVGTVPAVKPAVNASRKRRIGVLGTARTIDDPYIKELAGRYGPDCTLTGIAAPRLVNFVEQGGDSAGIDEQRRQVEPYVARFCGAGIDAVVLGCTHFIFLRAAFEAASRTETPGEGIRIFDSVEGVVGRAESLLEETDSGGGRRTRLRGGALRPATSYMTDEVAGALPGTDILSVPSSPPTQHRSASVHCNSAPAKRFRVLPPLRGPAADGFLPPQRPRSPGNGRQNLLILTGDGPPEERWRQRAEAAGLSLRLFSDFPLESPGECK